MKKILSKKFRDKEEQIKRKLAGNKAEATKIYNQKLRKLLNIKES